MSISMSNFFKCAAVCAIALTGSVATASIPLINGDFEADVNDVAIGSYKTVFKGDNLINGWSVDGKSVDLILGNYNAISGVSVDLAGTPGPGAIVQSFFAVAGTTYRLDWQYDMNGGFQDLIVNLGTTSKTITTAPTTGVVSDFLMFKATSSGMVNVSLGTSNATNQGPVVDNIVLTVAAVPEPHEWAMMLAGLGIVGTIASRRRRAGDAR